VKALSIRQPWAWLILHAGKDVENRTRASWHRGPLLIHASSTMTRADYAACELFLDATPGLPGRGVLPKFEELERGGIVGMVQMVNHTFKSDSPWFVGPVGYVLENPVTLEFFPCKGSLNFFEVTHEMVVRASQPSTFGHQLLQ
jgi:hypothetical protein